MHTTLPGLIGKTAFFLTGSYVNSQIFLFPWSSFPITLPYSLSCDFHGLTYDCNGGLDWQERFIERMRHIGRCVRVQTHANLRDHSLNEKGEKYLKVKYVGTVLYRHYCDYQSVIIVYTNLSSIRCTNKHL